MKLSVIICTFNRSATLGHTLEGFLAQEAAPGKDVWELVVVDNNSVDDTKEVVARFTKTSALNVRYHFEKRQGKSFAANAGVEVSGGEVLAFTDDDVRFDRHWLAAILEATGRHPHRAFGGRVLPIWPDKIPPWIQVSGPYRKPVVGGPIPVHDHGEEIREYGEGMWAPVGGNMFFRREVFSLYGGFNVEIGPRGDVFGTNEDCEYGFRLMCHGEKILYYPGAIVYHPVPQYKFSREYLLKYARDVGRQQAGLELAKGLSVGRRLKALLKATLLASQRGFRTLANWHSPPARMHHQFLFQIHLARAFGYLRGERS